MHLFIGRNRMFQQWHAAHITQHFGISKRNDHLRLCHAFPAGRGGNIRNPVRILDIDPCITDRVVFRFRTEAIGFASLKIARADIGTQRTVIIKVDRTITHIVAKTVMKIRNSFKNIHP